MICDVSHQKGIDMKLDSRQDSRQKEILYSAKSTKLVDMRIDIDDEAQLSFEGDAFYMKITQINGDKYKGTIIKAGFDPKVHPNLGVNNDIEFEKDNIFCIGKTGVQPNKQIKADCKFRCAPFEWPEWGHTLISD